MNRLNGLLLGTTVVTTMCYLFLFLKFRSIRTYMVTQAIFIVVIIIIIIGGTSDETDKGLSIANLVCTYITGLLAIILWSSKVALDAHGEPLELKDYFERNDLDSMPVVSDDRESIDMFCRTRQVTPTVIATVVPSLVVPRKSTQT